MTLEGYKGETDSGLHYSVRVSSRAKRCIIKFWGSSFVEVVVPRSFDQTLIPQMMDEQMDRIIRKQEEARRLEMQNRPESIVLKSVGETWKVSYQDNRTGDVFVREQPWYNLHVLGYARDISSTTSALNA